MRVNSNNLFFVWLRAVALGLFCYLPSLVMAANYPDRPIKWIVPYPPGGTTDVIARNIAQNMRELLGQPIVIENKPGAGGQIAMNFVAKSPADGYTFLYTTSGVISVNPIFSNSSFDPLKNLSPVILTSTLSSVMVVHPSLNIKTVPELIQYAKENPLFDKQGNPLGEGGKQRTVVKRGKEKSTGRSVVQYSDGTTEYAD